MLGRSAEPPPPQPEWPLADAVDLLRIWREAGSPPIRLRAGVHIMDFEKWLGYPTPPALLHTHLGAVTDFIDRLARGEVVSRADEEDDWQSSAAGLPLPEAYQQVAVVLDDGPLTDASPAEMDAPALAGMEQTPAPGIEDEPDPPATDVAPDSAPDIESAEPPATDVAPAPEPDSAPDIESVAPPATDVAPAPEPDPPAATGDDASGQQASLF